MVRPWRRIGSTRLQDCRVFDVAEVRFTPPDGGAARVFYRIDATEWVNVVPLTPDHDVLLLRQYRFGVEDFTLEIPGGMCDAGEDPRAAAVRELREETGYESSRIEELGWVHPNPALQGNRCHCFLARDVVRVGAPCPDLDESFELIPTPLVEIPGLIRGGKITHSLVVAAFHLLHTAGVRP